MRLLFWIALLLAIPTVGVSLLLYFGLYIFRAYAQGKASQHQSNIHFAAGDMMNNKGVMPTWYGDPDKLDLFLKTLRAFALSKGVSQIYVDAALKITGDDHAILKYAGALERQGSSFLEQQAACSEFLVKLLSKVEDGSLNLDQ
jgi:hypothetical protein